MTSVPPGEITALAGCDLLTISPKLLEELSNATEPLTTQLSETIGQWLGHTAENHYLQMARL